MSESKSKLEKVNYMFERSLEVVPDSPIDLINLLASDAKYVWLRRDDGVEDITQQEFYNLYIKAIAEELPQEVVNFLYESYKLSETQEHRFSEILERIRKRVRVLTGMTIYETRKIKDSPPIMLQ